MRRRDFIAAATFGLAALTTDGRGGAAAKADKYRVAIIGRTRQGDYGHGLDVVWNDVPQAQVVAVGTALPNQGTSARLQAFSLTGVARGRTRTR